MRLFSFAFQIFGLAVCCVICSCSCEPSWNGRLLSKWLIDINNPDLEKSDQARIAVENIGTNAIPILLKTITTDHRWDYSLWIGNHECALAAFDVLGSSAKPWSPVLCRLLTNQTSSLGPDNVFAIASAMVAINGDLIQWLADGLKHVEPQLRIVCMERLYCLGTNAVDVLPLIDSKLNDDNWEVRQFALMYYVVYGPDVFVKTKVLQRAVEDPDYRVRTYANAKLREMKQ